MAYHSAQRRLAKITGGPSFIKITDGPRFMMPMTLGGKYPLTDVLTAGPSRIESDLPTHINAHTPALGGYSMKRIEHGPDLLAE